MISCSCLHSNARFVFALFDVDDDDDDDDKGFVVFQFC
jgi:hypothetical protein